MSSYLVNIMNLVLVYRRWSWEVFQRFLVVIQLRVLVEGEEADYSILSSYDKGHSNMKCHSQGSKTS